MSLILEMSAFSEQINLTLLNDIRAFVIDAAKADIGRIRELDQRCIFVNETTLTSNFQSKYGFLYLGELLERYEERFGMSIQDRRAIALALGYTKDIATREMFVGNQRTAFLRSLRRYVGEDVYLTGAMYLLNAGDEDAAEWMERLHGLCQEKTEDLIFAMSLSSDFEHVFLRFKERLVYLLGKGRTFDLQGNMGIIAWAIARLQPIIKTVRGRDVAVLRSLCTLPSAFVKAESKHHTVLLECGYTPFEIAYANMMAVRLCEVPDALNNYSIVTEKIVIELFRHVFEKSEAVADKTYDFLSRLVKEYSEFSIRCYGHSQLLEALEEGPAIQNANTFAWFINHAPIHHSAFRAFDILDKKWDTLGIELQAETYQKLFESALHDSLKKDEIQARINRFDEITGSSYLGLYRENARCSRFSLLVESGVIDLWTEFQTCVDDAGLICGPVLLNYIKSYVRRLGTVQVYRFYQEFFPKYGFEGYRKYLKPEYGDFTDGLMEGGRSRFSSCKLTLERDFWAGNEQSAAQLLQWMEEYLFQYRPSDYIDFICGLLKSQGAEKWLPKDSLRALLDLFIEQSEGFNSYEVFALKQRYWTSEELEAEAVARKAAELVEENRIREQRKQVIQCKFAARTDRTFESIYKFMRFDITSSEDRSIAYEIVGKALPHLLAKNHFALGRREGTAFLQICGELVHENLLSFCEAQLYICKIKEAPEYGAGNDANEHPERKDDGTDEGVDQDEKGESRFDADS